MADATFSEDLLLGLTPEQRDAVTSPARRLLVRATAGSGKTHVLTLRIQRRIALDEVAPEHVLAMTFTRKAGDELRKRLFRAGVRDLRAGTFHTAARRLVDGYRHDHGLRPLVIAAQRGRLVEELLTTTNEERHTRLEGWQSGSIEQEISWALSQGIQGADYIAAVKHQRHHPPVAAPLMAELLDRYVGLCRAKGVVDFDLLLLEAINLLRSNDAVLAGFRYTTRALFVDETQDMNPLQFTLLKVMAGGDPDLFCVGDPNQSIYGFNGASPKLLGEIADVWPDTEVIDLTRNHRSTAAIVDVANTMLETGAAGITPAREGGETPVVRGYNTDLEEAAGIVRWLQAHHTPGVAWRSLAVLSRTNAHLDLIASSLEAAGIPFDRRGPEHGPGYEQTAEWKPHHDADAPDAVVLSTIHRSKGLEFAHVVVMGWAEDVLPNYNATTDSAMAEERRLAYVALSRAETSLFLTWSRHTEDTRFPPREQSRFLTPIMAAIAAQHAANAPLEGEARHARLAAIRATLANDEPSAG